MLRRTTASVITRSSASAPGDVRAGSPTHLYGGRRTSKAVHPLKAALDVVVGAVFGVLAASNLVQGSWTQQIPWLDLTTVSFVLAVPVAVLTIRRRLPVSAFVGILLLIGSLSLGFLEPPLSAASEYKRFGVILAVGAVAVAVMLTLSNRRRLVAFLATITVLAFVVVGGQLLAPDPLQLALGRRTPRGVNAIGAGRIVGAGLIVVVVLVTSSARRRWLFPLTLLATVLASGLLLAGSRGPLVGALAACVLILWRQPGLSRPAKALISAVAAVAAVVTLRSLYLAGSRLTSSSGSGRQQLYLDAIAVALKHPFGIGWGNFYRFTQSSVAAAQQGEGLYVHNILLEFWIETGAIGALVFSSFLLLVASRGMRQSSSAIGLALLALALDLFVGALFSSDVVGNRMMWVVFAAILAGGAVHLGDSSGSNQETGLERSRYPIARPR